MADLQRDDARLAWWEWVVLLAATVVFIVVFSQSNMDDAYISYRYSQNVVLGRGLVFNPGVRLMGSTSPGEVLLGIPAYALAGQQVMPRVMAALGVVAWMAQALAVRWLVGRALGTLAGRALGLLVMLGAASQASYVSMETNTAVALNLAALEAFQRERPLRSSALHALASLFRPDAVLFLLVALPLYARHLKRRIALPALLFVGLAAVWPVFALLYFGRATPQSLHTKAFTSTVGQYLGHELTFIPAEAVSVPLPGVGGAVVGWALFVWGAIALARRRSPLVVFPAFAVTHLAAYLALRPFTLHVWHLMPAVLAAAVTVFAGLWLALQHLPRRAFRAVGGVVLAAFALLEVHRLVEVSTYVRDGFWTGQRDRVYREVATYLLEAGQPDDVVASLEVGTIAYYTDQPMADLGAVTNAPVATELVHGKKRVLEISYDWLLLDKQHADQSSGRPLKVFGADTFPLAVFKSRFYDARHGGALPAE